jgi:beta-carotene/zeaxanthin 4-ketolase
MRHSKSPSLVGIGVAAVIILLWVSSLGILLHINLEQLTIPLILAATLGRTFVQTGLFIVAHDAMHGTVLPSAGAASPGKNRYWNNAIGHLAMTLYALLPYQKLAASHQRHHLHPGCCRLVPNIHGQIPRSATAGCGIFWHRGNIFYPALGIPCGFSQFVFVLDLADRV